MSTTREARIEREARTERMRKMIEGPKAKPDFKELTAGRALAHLYRRFPPPEFFCAHEMELGRAEGDTSFYGRRADFIALRLWGHRYGPVHGFEIKVTRQDFLHEMRQPEKRAALEAVCGACWFVAPAGVLQLEELPPGWGWLELQKKGLRMRRTASTSANAQVPVAFMGKLMKRVLDAGYHNRDQRPAVLDFPARLWEMEGRDITPGQLLALMHETLHAPIQKVKEAMRQEAREHYRKDLSEAEAHSKAMEEVVCKALGISPWELHRHDQKALLALAENYRATGSARTIRHLQNAEGQIKRVLEVIAEAREAIQAEVPEEEG